VVEAETIAPERQKAIAQGLREMTAQQEMLAYVASLRQKAASRSARKRSTRNKDEAEG
jgi:hypothetical protein